MERYDQKVLTQYLWNILNHSNRFSPYGKAACNWLTASGYAIGVHLETDDDDETPRRRRSARRIPGIPLDRWKIAKKAVEQRLATYEKVKPTDSALHLQHLGEILDLDPISLQILGLILRYKINASVESLWDEMSNYAGLGSNLSINTDLISSVLACRKADVATRLDRDSPLVRSGLIWVDDDGEINALERLQRILLTPRTKNTNIRQMLLGKPALAELDWEDFDHIAEDRDHVLAVVKAAITEKRRGVNILLYGPPGVGKTTFCKTLAARLGQPIFLVGEESDGGGEPSRDERIGHLQLCQSIFSRGERNMMMFDEAEDLFSSRAFLGSSADDQRYSGSKAFVHRLLEETPSPTFWTTNDTSTMSPAVLRRMTYAIELRVPPAAVRARVWDRILKRNKLALKKDEIIALARDFPAPPAIAATAVASAKMMGGGALEVRRAVMSLTKVINGGAPMIPRRSGGDIAVDLINTDHDIAQLIRDVSKPGASRRVSMCFSGPSGSGKSELAKYMADVIGLEYIEKRYSDLESKYVGETEQNIAMAFAEARAANAVLLFDECDSLLSSREMAEHHWQVTRVNEMLTWMESHPLPFIATTNFKKLLDSATVRRFLFKVEFDYLKPSQCEAAFRKFFGMEPPAGLGGVSRLTPADFDIVRRKAEFQDRLGDADWLLANLRMESKDKPGAARGIGFGAAL